MKVLPILFSALFFTSAINCFAALKMVPASGGTNIVDGTAADGSAPAWTSLGMIELHEEGHTRAELVSGTFHLRLPNGFEFNTNQTPSISFPSKKDMTNATIVVADPQTLIITLDVVGILFPDSLYIGETVAIQVRPTTSTPLAKGHIYWPAIDGGTISLPLLIPSLDGTTGTSFGDLGMIEAPLPVSLAITKLDETFQLRVIGNTNLIYTIQSNDDLNSTNWQTVGVSTLGLSGLQELVGVVPTSPNTFYRAVQP